MPPNITVLNWVRESGIRNRNPPLTPPRRGTGIRNRESGIGKKSSVPDYSALGRDRDCGVADSGMVSPP
ncbi:hypothetical protein [Moorena producens]|uniref:hypothetical protein n=1 Tax=Moorena producens TaxID=1155739 RepID=UPI003C772F1D